eukprot:scaffold148324_cov17-Tisochrysis_lutea.AAC.2
MLGPLLSIPTGFLSSAAQLAGWRRARRAKRLALVEQLTSEQAPAEAMLEALKKVKKHKASGQNDRLLA